MAEDYTDFEIAKYPNYYVPTRMQSMTLRDALVDPHQTATGYTDPLVRKDPGYVELNKRSQIEQDMTSKVIKDSNGNLLADGDSVQVIKDLKVKGTSVTLKRGTTAKNIRLTSNEDEIECNVEKVRGLVLKTCFVKKV